MHSEVGRVGVWSYTKVCQVKQPNLSLVPDTDDLK